MFKMYKSCISAQGEKISGDSMDFWDMLGEEIKKRLEITAKIAYQLDEEMRKIRDDIQEAQALFDPAYRKLNDGVGNSDDTDEEFR